MAFYKAIAINGGKSNAVRLSACPPVRLSACPPVRLSACPPVRLSACPPVRLSACPPVRLTFLVLMGWDIRIDRAVLRGAQQGKHLLGRGRQGAVAVMQCA